MSEEPLPRHLELAVDEALQRLCPNEWVEFDRAFPPSPERERLLLELEALVANVALVHSPQEDLPAGLADQILDAYEATATRGAKRRSPQYLASVTQLNSPTRRSKLVQSAGWLVAAAVALGFWLSRVPSAPTAGLQTPKSASSSRVQAPPAAPAPTEEPPTPAEQRLALLARKGTHRVEWSTTQDSTAKNASGDLVWDGEKQLGFMRFHGLAPNDPTKLSYQLWIFDAERDEAHPIDGGVFDVDSAGEQVIPIDPRVPVHRATLFAVTIEPPGGVVVSQRERIVVTAAIPPT